MTNNFNFPCTVHCFFEQSGVFKNEFKKLGISSFDYDILNDFGETDFNIDLFCEILSAYDGKRSIFDNFSTNDLIFAFFPCTRFENQILMAFNGTAFQLKNKSVIEKLEYDLVLHRELSLFYEIITKLTIVCLKNNIPLIIENPYSTTHYLNRYWCIKSSIIDYDRTKRGDIYEKPTQYWFIGLNPKNNFCLDALCYNYSGKKILQVRDKVKRSLISPDYARRFIKEFIL